MATDFTYGNKTINSNGGFKPSGKNTPIDVRTRVNTFADIASIPVPYIGMIITVLEDETNSNKMTDYKVLSLKANASGIANSVIDQVQRYVNYLGAGNVSQDDINTAINNYLTEHPVAGGATTEQAAQIEANRTAIGDTNSGLIKKVNDIENYVNEKTSNIPILNQNGNTPLYIWAGTKTEYDALLTYDTNTVYLVEGGSISTITTYTVTNNLTNVTNSNTSGRIEENTSYTAMLSPSSGYEISTVTVTMGGADITSTAYSNGYIEISSVTGNIIITATGVVSDNPTVTYTITNNLTNLKNSNSATSIEGGSSYTATISANSGYKIDTVSVTMGGTNVTNGCYSNGQINIPNVSGDIVILGNGVEYTISKDYSVAYTLQEETTFDGTTSIDTGYSPFDSDKDFTIIADFTNTLEYNDITSVPAQPVLFRTKQSASPWIGVEIIAYPNNDTMPNRGDIISSTNKYGWYLAKMATGKKITSGERLKFAIKRVASERKLYFYDTEGLIGSYEDPGDVASNTFTGKIILGTTSVAETPGYFKGTVNRFTIYNDAVINDDITAMLQ